MGIPHLVSVSVLVVLSLNLASGTSFPLSAQGQKTSHWSRLIHHRLRAKSSKEGFRWGFGD